MDLSSNRVDGMLPSSINGLGVFWEARIGELIGRPVPALENLVPADLSIVADRTIADIRNYDQRFQYGDLVYRVELVAEYEPVQTEPPQR